jgi:hypothetical protein
VTTPLVALGSTTGQNQDHTPRRPATDANGAGVETTPVAARGPRIGLRDGEPVLGYVSGPTGPDGTGIHRSERAIEQACRRSGWRLLDVLHDLESRSTMRRPGLFAALERIADGEARGLVVSDARLLGRSIVDLAPLMRWFRDASAAFIALDLGLDTSTPRGTRVAMALIRLSSWDRGGPVNGNGNGNGNGLAALRADGATNGAATQARAELLARLAAMHDDDMSLEEMAERLNAEGVPTLNGGDVWWPSSVRTALRYARAKRVSLVEDLPSLEDRAPS